MNNKYYLLQPLIEYGITEYNGDDADTPCQSIWYCGISHNGMTFISDGCAELVCLWKKNKAKIFFPDKTRLNHINTEETYVHGVRLCPGYNFNVTNKEIELMEQELGRIFDKSDRELYIRTRLENKINKVPVHPAVNYMLTAVLVSSGKITVEEMADNLGYSTRHINNLFTQSLGYGPKSFCRYIRFQNSLYAILLDPFRNNSGFIENQSYSDQAHFQREFKAFMGMTPKQFVTRYFY